jgi:AcrR family transcriptional regulator
MTAAQRIRAQAREASRQALLEAGLAEIIARGGLEDASVEAICSRAGYTRGAFYVHFRDREHFDAEMFEWVLGDILTALWVNAVGDATDIREIIRRFNGMMAARDWPDLHGDIRAGYLSVLRNIVGGATQVRERHAQLMGRIIDMLAECIRLGQKEGTLRTDIDPQYAATLILMTGIAEIVWDDIGLSFEPPRLGETLNTFLEPSNSPL